MHRQPQGMDGKRDHDGPGRRAPDFRPPGHGAERPISSALLPFHLPEQAFLGKGVLFVGVYHLGQIF